MVDVPPEVLVTVADSTAPTVAGVAPANGAVDVAVTTSITVAPDGLSATFTPAATLVNSTVHTVTVTSGIADLAGNALDQDGNPLNGNQGITSTFTTLDRPGIIEMVRRLKLTNEVASASVSLFLFRGEIRGRVLTRDFPRPNSAIDRAALCLINAADGAVSFIGDNKIDWDDEDEPWRMSHRATGITIETLVGATVEIVNIGPARIAKPDQDAACAKRSAGDVVLTIVLTENDVEVIGEPMVSPPTLLGLPPGLTIDDVEEIDGFIFRRPRP